MTGEILNRKLANFVAGIVTMWREKTFGIKWGKKENLIAQDLEPSLLEKASHLLIITPDVATWTKSSVLLIELNKLKLNRTIRFD